MSKADNLLKLKKKGFDVPRFIVVDKNFKGKAPFENMSVRSSPPVSLPGLMVSFLNVKESDLLDKIKKVYDSWNDDVVNKIKKSLNIKNEYSQIIIQEMIPLNTIIGSGVASLRNPITKKDGLCLSYKKGVYCDKVVMGDSGDECDFKEELSSLLMQIDNLFGKNQEIEFSITDSGIKILQSRDLVTSNLTYEKLNCKNLIKIGEGFSSFKGSVKGRAVFEKATKEDILCLRELNPSEIDSLINAKAILSKNGDHNSHIAVLCRVLNKPYILSANINCRINFNDTLILNEDGLIFIDN